MEEGRRGQGVEEERKIVGEEEGKRKGGLKGGEVGDGGGSGTLHLLHCITYCYFTDF